MIEVRIREESEVDSKYLTYVPPTAEALRAIRDLVSSWGTNGGESVVGQFSTDGYFELVVVSDDA